MKQLLSTVFFILTALLLGQSFVHAQGTVQGAVIAFEKADRSVLYVKQPDSAANAIDFAALDPHDIDSIRHLALIGMTPDHQRVLMAASVGYLSPLNGLHSVSTGLFSVKLQLGPNPLITGDIKVLMGPPLLPALPFGTASFRPIGILSADGTQWWVAFTSSSTNLPLKFYHGNMDGSGTIDSVEVTATVAGHNAALQGGYQLSNLSLDESNHTMVAVSIDGLDDQQNNGRALLYNWSLNGSFSGLNAIDFTGSLKTLRQGVGNIDSLFGLSVHAVGDGSNVDIGLTVAANNSISFYRTRYSGVSTISLSNVVHTIPRSAIPSTMNFFAGFSVGPYQENNPFASQYGQGGDMSFSPTGDTVYFVTHEAPDNANQRNPQSAIYQYAFSSNTSKLIYNDSNAQELQPVFVGTKTIVPPPPPPVSHYAGISATPGTLTFSATDTGSTSVLNIAAADTSAFVDASIDSVQITPATVEFLVKQTFPVIVTKGASVNIPVTFAPQGSAGTRNAILKLYFGSKDSARTKDSIRQISLKGTATVKASSGVREDPTLALNVSIMPNPFNASTTVTLTAPEAGTIGFAVYDGLGRKVYISDERKAEVGSTETFEFNAKSLGLPNGVYYVTAFFGDRQITRQVAFIH